MPLPYDNAVMTAAGAALLDRVRAGLAAIEFTRMVTGDGTYTADEKISSALRECTGLKSSRNSYPLSSVSIIPGGGMRLTALFTDQDPVTGEALVSEGYHINEIGLYAKEEDADDSTEVLYSITVAAGDIGDYMPAYTGGAPVQIVQEYHAKVSDTASVSIASAGAVMLVEDALREFEDLKRMIGEAGAIGDKTLTFERAEERDNIASGETLGVILGKLEKDLADLKEIAFTASYKDLVDKPDMDYIPTSDKGAAMGVATLDATGRIPDSQLPSMDYDPAGSVSEHNASPAAHEDIREGVISAFSSLSRVAVSGSYSDLSGIPEIPAAVRVKGSAEGTYRTGDVDITAADIGLGNVGDFKAVSTVASQGLTDTEKSDARANIGAGTSDFSGSYNDLSDKPDIPSITLGMVNALSGNLLLGSFFMSSDLPKYWSQGGPVTLDNEDPYGGRNALGVCLEGTSNMVSSTALNKPIKETGKDYRLSVWLKATKNLNGVKITINSIKGGSSLCDVTTEWKRFEVTSGVIAGITNASHVYIGDSMTLPQNPGHILYIYCPKVEYA